MMPLQVYRLLLKAPCTTLRLPNPSTSSHPSPNSTPAMAATYSSIHRILIADDQADVL